MSYTPEHKTRTRERIVQAASRLFKRHGYRGVGIDAVMAEAGLTRGGFYAHFTSKEDLFAQVIREFPRIFSAELRQRMDEEPVDRPDWPRRFVEFYLSREHRGSVAEGCVVPALSADVSRAEAPVRTAYTENFQGIAAALTRELNGDEASRRRAIATMAICIGGVTLARAVNDENASEEILTSCREAALEQIGMESGARAGSSRLERD